MAVNFLDPNQENQYRNKAIEAGYSISDIDSYVTKKKESALEATKLGLDIKKQDVESLKIQKDILDLQNGDQKDLSDLTDFEKKVVNARLAGQKALDILSEGSEVAGPITTRMGRLGEFVGMPGKGTEYRSAINLAAAQLFNALAGTAQSEAELKRLEKLMPKDTEQEATAMNKLNTLLGMLDDQAQVYGIDLESATGNQDSSLLTPEEQVEMTADKLIEANPVVNDKGEIASPGDLITNDETGEMSIYGDPDFKGSVFKKTKYGGSIDNSLVKFLAESSFLPIVGGVAGAILGSGFASIGTGAVGAATGKAAQQAMRELVDPEKYEMTDHAQAIVTEGVVDAIFAGVFFGVGALAGKGVRMVLGRTAKEVAEEGVEAATKGAAKEAGEEAFEYGTAEGFVKKGLGLKSKEIGSYRGSFGGNLVEEATEKGYKSLPDAAVISAKEGGEAVAKLNKLLSGKSVNPKNLVKVLDDVEASFLDKSGNVKVGYERAIKQISRFKKEALSWGDSIPLKEVQSIKKRLQKSFSGSTSITTDTKEVMRLAAKKTRQFIEEFHPEIAGTNKEIRFNYLIKEAAIKKLDNAMLRSIWRFHDLVTGIISPKLLVSNKALEIFVNQFDDLAKARLLNAGLEQAVADGNRRGVSNILRLMNKMGVSFSAAPGAKVRSGIRGAAAGVATQAVTEDQPGILPEDVSDEEIIQNKLYR